MEYYKNGKLLAKAFVDGANEGCIGSKRNPGNLKIVGNQLFHYETPILERSADNQFILNVSRYSQVTGLIQKWLKNETLIETSYKEAHKVPYGYKGTLEDFTK